MKILTPHPTMPDGSSPTLEGIRSELKAHPEQYNAQFGMLFFHNHEDRELTEFGHTLTILGNYLKVSEFRIGVGKVSINVKLNGGHWVEGAIFDEMGNKKKYGWVSQQAFDSGVNGVIYKTPDGDTVEIFKYTDSPENKVHNGWSDLECIGEVTQFVRTVKRKNEIRWRI